MEIKTLNVTVDQKEEDYYVVKEALSCVDEPAVNFSVYNLSEYPEDAIIGRSLFDTKDYIKVLELGMELASKGYNAVSVSYTKSEE